MDLQVGIDWLTNALYSYWLVYLLVGVGLWFTLRTGFVQVRLFPAMLRQVLSSRHDAAGGISSFQAFAVGLASRVGTGNIAGVAVALTLGGPGAIFWMWVVALIGMATAFVEATLAQVFKVRADDGSYRGGPAYYIERGLGSRRWGVVFAVLLVVTFGFAFNMVQANTIAETLASGHSLPVAWTAVALVVLAAPVLFGGVRRVARVAEVALPLMAALYLLVALVVVVLNLGAVPDAFAQILRGAFGLDSALAGTGGGVLAAVLNGTKRGLFSNEAGMGSAPNAAATATVSHPVKQGLIQSLGVFVDTMLVCSATAMLVLLAGPDVYSPGETGASAGAALTAAAVAHELGGWTTWLMSVVVFTFAFSSVLGNYAYAEVNLTFLGVHGRALTALRTLVLAAVGLGSLLALTTVWAVADIAMALMAMVNLVAILLLSRWALGALADYRAARAGGTDARFVGQGNALLPGDVPGDVWGAGVRDGVQVPRSLG
ncbi:alanine/glycine:cation symporter family protein [Cellulomonas shaoxiangyii]|uniref:Alanine:cation symporter family protein n=1 Tax=Cellulomonas shaoxiangyii TaxID=2566013 RepID=A0A4P7SL27_9CELL|nr:alanine/glycine:cation symporter family protein [Cellulomonas shaoxiangyii]QCB94187.1 alanine:cation symporter family protein [Cellulomonas shaoxiangyii]TGY86680.1 alanine:cation symporter family protein [Cellulomonas shaoxiangyii]